MSPRPIKVKRKVRTTCKTCKESLSLLDIQREYEHCSEKCLEQDPESKQHVLDFMEDEELEELLGDYIDREIVE